MVAVQRVYLCVDTIGFMTDCGHMPPTGSGPGLNSMPCVVLARPNFYLGVEANRLTFETVGLPVTSGYRDSSRR